MTFRREALDIEVAPRLGRCASWALESLQLGNISFMKHCRDNEDDFSSIKFSVTEEDLPELDCSISSVESISSLPTEAADPCTHKDFLDESPNETEAFTVSKVSRRQALYCPFTFLDCAEVYDFSRISTWKEHCKKHFRGLKAPVTALCPLCGMRFEDKCGDHVPGAWDLMLRHLAHSHFSKGQTLATARPDFDLYVHMWKRRLISDTTLRSLNLNPSPRSYDAEQFWSNKATAKDLVASTDFEEVLISSDDPLSIPSQVDPQVRDKLFEKRYPADVNSKPRCSDLDFAARMGFSDESFASDLRPQHLNGNNKRESSIPVVKSSVAVQASEAFVFLSESPSSGPISIGHRTIDPRQQSVADIKGGESVTRLLDEIFWQVWHKWGHSGVKQCGTGTSTNRSSSNSSHCSNSTGSFLARGERSDNSLHNGGRQGGSQGADNDDGGDGPGGSRHYAKTSTRSAIKAPLRCPFIAADLPGGLHRSCLKVATRDVDDLKHYHLKKHHGLTTDEMKISRGGSEEHKWQKLFCKVFPSWQSVRGDLSLPSPYAEANYRLLQEYTTATTEEAQQSQELLVQMNAHFSSLPSMEHDLSMVSEATWENPLFQGLDDTLDLANQVAQSEPVFPTVSSVMTAAPSSLEQFSAEEINTICRCSSHTDVCGNRHFDESEATCLCCLGWLPWSNHAAAFLRVADGATVCRCRQHDTMCIGLRHEYDARKCACCKGWYAWSEQADPLIGRQANDTIQLNTKDSDVSFEISNFMDLNDSPEDEDAARVREANLESSAVALKGRENGKQKRKRKKTEKAEKQRQKAAKKAKQTD